MKIHRFLAALAGVLIGMLATFAAPAGPASAHAALVRTQPAAGSVVTQAPKEVVITFSEPVSPVREKIKIIGPDGRRADRGEPTVTGNDLHIPLRSDVPRGTFVVAYRVISADSHPVGAGFSFSVGAPSATAPASAGADAGRTDPVVATAVSVSRYLGYAGLIMVVGPALILAALWPRRLSRRTPTRLALAGLGLIGLATVLEIYLEAPYSVGVGLFGSSGADLTDVLTSKYGQAHLVRLVVLVAVLFPLRRLLAGRAGSGTRVMLAVLAALGALTWGYGGHPGASAAPLLTMVADAAHLSSMAIWIGGLVTLSLFVLRRVNSRELGAILPIWSNWATLAVSVLVLAGVAQALVEIGSVGALLHTGYGQLVMVKVGLLALVLAAAAVSRRLVLRRAVGTIEVPAAAVSEVPAAVTAGGPPVSAGDDGPTTADADRPASSGPGHLALRRLRGAILAEVLGAVLILGLTSVLVQTTPARTVAATSGAQGQQSGIYSTTLSSKLYQLQIDIQPAKVGTNEIHLYAYTPIGVPIKVLEWQVRAGLPAAGIEPIDAVLTPVTDSHEIGQITLPTAGQWQFSFTLRTTEIDEATVSAVVDIG